MHASPRKFDLVHQTILSCEQVGVLEQDWGAPSFFTQSILLSNWQFIGSLLLFVDCVFASQCVVNNKEADNDWFRLESNKDGTRSAKLLHCSHVRPGKLDLLFHISACFTSVPASLRPAASNVIIAFQTITCPLLMVVAP